MVLKVIDLKGQLVDQRDLGMLPQGENRVQLDPFSFHAGIYHIQGNAMKQYINPTWMKREGMVDRVKFYAICTKRY